jgi:hypothetical protein
MRLNISGLIDCATALATSWLVGQMSRRNTGLPAVSVPSGSLCRSMSTRPAMAKATTRGGDIR